jgi:hypothetical protein
VRPEDTPQLRPTSEKPIPFLYRELKPDWPNQFSKISDFDATKTLKWPFLVKDAFSSLLKVKPRSAEQEAFLLVKRALAESLLETIDSALNGEKVTLKQVRKEAAARLDEQLTREPVELSSQFFRNPGRAGVVGTVVRLLASWLCSAGLNQEQADAAVQTLPARFVAHLGKELTERGADYQRLTKAHSPNFTAATDEEAAWLLYHAELLTSSNPPVLNLGVSLDEVYVELRAYTQPTRRETMRLPEEQVSPTVTVWNVGMLMEMAKSWMDNDDDAIFVLSGGPGAGKSAFARRFAAWRAWAGPIPWRVLFVPLHRFKLGAELKHALTAFASAEIRHSVKLFDLESDNPVLVVFDGLDELAQQGSVGEELAADFFRQVDDFVKDCNREWRPLRVRAVLCGRPVAVSITSAEIRRAERVRYLLPYKVERESLRGFTPTGQPDLVAIDQRDQWWNKYGAAVGEPELTGIPPDVRTEKLDPLTSEPILNGLIAESRKNHAITPDTNRAQIYEWLLLDVLKRVHDRSGKQHLKDAKEDDIARLLEEVAVTAWHNGDVRATTKTKVRERCEKTDQMDLLNCVFPDHHKANITSLFLAFYFQEAGERQGQDRAFEFSHKSFGEYLLARRIIHFVRELDRRIRDGAWDAEVGLKRWVELFGPTGINIDLASFVRDAADLHSEENVNAWRETLIKLLNRAIRRGMPMTQVGLASYQIMERENWNAVGALFAIHSCCYRPGRVVFPVDWGHPPRFPSGKPLCGQTRLLKFRYTNIYAEWI